MKTIKDLINNLNLLDNNRTYDCSINNGKYVITAQSNSNTYIMLKISRWLDTSSWEIGRDLYLIPLEFQSIIIDFLSQTDKRKWFEEDKYNIIIGTDGNMFLTAYHKSISGHPKYSTDSWTNEFKLNEPQYQFTDSEIEDLKDTLSDNMREIVELGKERVNNEQE